MPNKPPGICLKPPPGREWVPPDMNDQTFQGYVEYCEPFTPSEGALAGPITLRPDPPLSRWIGSYPGELFEIYLTMHLNPATKLLDFEMEWYIGHFLYDTVYVNDVEPRAWSPFDSGEISVDPPDWPKRVGWHIWS